MTSSLNEEEVGSGWIIRKFDRDYYCEIFHLASDNCRRHLPPHSADAGVNVLSVSRSKAGMWLRVPLVDFEGANFRCIVDLRVLEPTDLFTAFPFKVRNSTST